MAFVDLVNIKGQIFFISEKKFSSRLNCSLYFCALFSFSSILIRHVRSLKRVARNLRNLHLLFHQLQGIRFKESLESCIFSRVKSNTRKRKSLHQGHLWNECKSGDCSGLFFHLPTLFQSLHCRLSHWNVQNIQMNKKPFEKLSTICSCRNEFQYYRSGGNQSLAKLTWKLIELPQVIELRDTVC